MTTSPPELLDCVVIGAGVVGLACARALAQAGLQVVILEREKRFGGGISSRSSEVIHAGVHYPPGSLKARLCVRGKQLLYQYCTARHIPHRRCGKLIVSTATAQEAHLHHIIEQARACGVADLTLLSRAESMAREPHLAATAAVWSPSTGIIDSHALMQSLLADAEQHGATLVVATPVLGGEISPGWIELACGGEMPTRIRARIVINAAGLAAPHVARQLQGLPADSQPRAHYAKGNYFALRGHAPFKHLIYPLPEAAGLGIHLTLDLAGRARFGPDVEWLHGTDSDTFLHGLPPAALYAANTARQAEFEAAIRRYWPGLPKGALHPDYAGIRPKLHAPTAPAADFRIDGPHGSGLIQLLGIESPGLTSSLAIAEHVREVLGV